MSNSNSFSISSKPTVTTATLNFHTFLQLKLNIPMASIKSILVSLALTMAALQATTSSATPLVGDLGIGGPGTNGFSPLGCGPEGCATDVPIPPTTLAPETNFSPISNVLPIVNVFPVDVNDYSCQGGYGNYGDFDDNDYGYNYPGNYGGCDGFDNY
ncbi:hypothetical protein BGX26_006798, partial [Mortierella sp. AD094]